MKKIGGDEYLALCRFHDDIEEDFGLNSFAFQDATKTLNAAFENPTPQSEYSNCVALMCAVCGGQFIAA